MLSLKTTYYAADVPIWIDIVNPAGVSEWADDFSEEEAAEVLAAVGGYIVLVSRGIGKTGWEEVKRVLKEVERVIRVSEVAEDEKWEGVCLGVLLETTAGEDDEFWVENWELVDRAARGKNEFGEVVGVERVREALETNVWDKEKEDKLKGDLGIGGGDVEGGFEIGEDEVERMRRPIFGRDDEEDEEGVEGMEALMLKMQAMRGEFFSGVVRIRGCGLTRRVDLGADMPEAERKKFAAKAVRDLMKTL